MSSDESDIEMHIIRRKETPKKRLIKAKIPKSPTEDTLEKDPKSPTKLTTGNMVEQALAFLDTRKGVSLYAIKRYMKENFQMDTEKKKHIIKKYMKNAIEKGTVIRTKGIGASGSFRLAPKKEVKPKKPKEKKEKVKKNKGGDKEKVKQRIEKIPKEKLETKSKKSKEKKTAKTKDSTKTKEKKSEVGVKKAKLKVTSKEVSLPKVTVAGAAKKKKVEIQLPMTPAKKKKLLAKRRSIGSIIKPPKMKPKSMKKTKTNPE